LYVPFLLTPFILPQKKFWVEVKPPGCTEKKHFMVIHDDGVAATANPESATFPDFCQVTLNLPDAEILHKEQGTIVGARDPVSKQYQVQLHNKETIESWGSRIVKVSEAQMKWHQPEPKNESQSEKEKEYVGTNKNSKLPSRPFISKTFANQNCNSTKAQVSFVSPDTLGTEGFRKDTPATGLNRLKDTPAPASPPPQRSLLSSPSSRQGISTCCLLASFSISNCLQVFWPISSWRISSRAQRKQSSTTCQPECFGCVVRSHRLAGFI
jgi:hypothetical protein